ncbi:MAG TPA: 30S ribosomal protein S5 [Candidatus Nanoarchaeia archaeon]|nr:30S ribosomal protein S5 [Candidatus Nanoarchaeia archaeon]
MKKETTTEEAIEALKPQEIVEPVDETKIEKVIEAVDSWKPITELGRKVKTGEITDLNVIFDKGLQIKESQIVDALMPNAESDLLAIGQSKGKFGGGKRKAFRQTQKKTNEGNKPKFATYAVIGNKNGFVGLGYGKTKETVPAREKALRNAKVNVMRIRRGCGSWQCNCKTAHSIPYEVTGKTGSAVIILTPAPKGTGLKVEKECQKILALAGIKDIYGKTFGQPGTKINLIKACEKALKNLTTTKVQAQFNGNLGITDGNKVQ